MKAIHMFCQGPDPTRPRRNSVIWHVVKDIWKMMMRRDDAMQRSATDKCGRGQTEIKHKKKAYLGDI